jgi:DNA polymerase-3 subunit alpha (Gram-positive type)
MLFHGPAGMDLLSRGMPCYQEKEQTLAFLFQREENARRAEESLPALKEFLAGVGITVICSISCRVFENKTEVKTVSQSPAPAAAARPSANGGFDRKKSYSRKLKKESYPVIRLKDVRDPADDIQFIGTVFKKEDIEIRSTGHLIQNLSVFDGEDAILVKRFEGRNFTREELDAVQENDRVHVYGSIIYDSYAKDLVCQAAAD